MNNNELNGNGKVEIEKNKSKKSLNVRVILSIFVVIILAASVVIINKTKSENFDSATISIEKYNGKNYYIIEGDYLGEYDLQYITPSDKLSENSEALLEFEKQEMMDYEEYSLYCSKCGITQKYTDTSKNYSVYSVCSMEDGFTLNARLAEVQYIDGEANVYLWDATSYDESNKRNAYIIVVPMDKEVNNINFIDSVIPREEFELMKNLHHMS